MRILSISSSKQLNTIKEELLQFYVHFINKGFFKVRDHGFGAQIKNAKTALDILQAIQNALVLQGSVKFNLALVEFIRKNDYLSYSESNVYEATRRAIVEDAMKAAKNESERYGEYHNRGGIAQVRYATAIKIESYSNFKTRCDGHLEDATTLIPDRLDIRYKEFFDAMQIKCMLKLVSKSILKVKEINESIGIPDLGSIVTEYSDLSNDIPMDELRI